MTEFPKDILKVGLESETEFMQKAVEDLQRGDYLRLITAIREEKLLGVVSEPLKTYERNFAYCPSPSECHRIQRILKNPGAKHNRKMVKSILEKAFCSHCPSDLWLFVFASKGLLLRFLLFPEDAEQLIEDIKKALDVDRED